MKIKEEKVKQVFADYVKNYDANDPKVKLKIIHTYKVAEISREIARSLPLEESEAELAWLTGMLHDIGRFEQLRQYNTFVDAKSFPHAKMSAQILFEEDMIQNFVGEDATKEELEMIHLAVLHHSDYRLPQDLSKRTEQLCNILRDADKIDILRANLETPFEDIYNVTHEELMNSEVSQAVMDNFMEWKATPKALKQTPVDNVVALISLSFELVYPKSTEILIAQGNIEKLLDFPSENAKTRQQFAALRQCVKRYQTQGNVVL